MALAQALASGSYSLAAKLLDESIKTAQNLGSEAPKLSYLLSNRAFCYERLNLNRKVPLLFVLHCQHCVPTVSKQCMRQAPQGLLIVCAFCAGTQGQCTTPADVSAHQYNMFKQMQGAH